MWDRISHPEQIIQSLPQATAMMLDPSDCGPAFIGLCQDTQEIAYEYPVEFFNPKFTLFPGQVTKNIFKKLSIKLNRPKPLIIAGGGVRYSMANEILRNFATKLNIPFLKQFAGKGL